MRTGIGQKVVTHEVCAGEDGGGSWREELDNKRFRI